MGQEMSMQNKCNVSRRSQEYNTQQQQEHYYEKPYDNYGLENLNKLQEKYTPHKELIYSSSSISNSSTTDDECYKHCQKYNLAKQVYERSKIAKQQLGSKKSLTSSSDSNSSEYQLNTKHYYPHLNEKALKSKHKSSRNSLDSVAYYSSWPSSYSSSLTASAISQKSNKSVQKQKEYLDHHLYIKSYLDILEEDEKARAQFQIARPGGIRNYTPKILADITLSASAPVANSFTRKSLKSEDPWI